MTVLELKQALSNLPDDGEVYVQRIEDFYFENNGWSVKKMEGENGEEQYIATWCCINYDGKNLYITSHY